MNFKRGILFFVYNTKCWLENVRRSTRVFSVWNLFSNCLLFCSWVVFGNCYYLRWLARGRGKAREKEREGKREEWEAMDSGIAFLGRGGSRDQDFCWVSIDCPFTDLSKRGDTTPFSIATTPRCREGRFSFPLIVPLYPWYGLYNAEC